MELGPAPARKEIYTNINKKRKREETKNEEDSFQKVNEIRILYLFLKVVINSFWDKFALRSDHSANLSHIKEKVLDLLERLFARKLVSQLMLNK